MPESGARRVGDREREKGGAGDQKSRLWGKGVCVCVGVGGGGWGGGGGGGGRGVERNSMFCSRQTSGEKTVTASVKEKQQQQRHKNPRAHIYFTNSFLRTPNVFKLDQTLRHKKKYI